MKRCSIFLVTIALVVMTGPAWAKGAPTTGGAPGVDTRLQTLTSTLNDDASKVGDATFADKFAAQFGVTVDVLNAQRTQFNASWGDLYLAYSVAASSKTTVTIDDIFAMRTSGQSWTQIARSLQIPPGKLVQRARAGISLASSSSTRGSSARTGGTTSGQTKAIAGVDKRIDTEVQSLNDDASRLGDQTVADKIAQDFGVTSDVLLSQKTQFSASWSDLLIAYTIQSKSKTTVTIDQIFAMRTDGQTWTQIARSLQVPPGQLLHGIRTETQGLTSTKGSGGTGAAMKAAHGAAATRITGSAALLHGKGATMRAAARITTTVGHGKH